jgi:Domain of unknown function (DUF4157)
MPKHARRLLEHSEAIPSKTQPERFTAAPGRAKPLVPGSILQRAPLAPESLRPADILRLQQTLGNRAVAQMLSQSSPFRSLVQAKLTVNAPGDQYEQEADRVAQEVIATPAVQRAEFEGEDEKEDEDEKPEVMTKPQPSRAAGGAFEASEEFEQQLGASRGQGQPLPPMLREEFETKFGADFSGVRVHTHALADQLNQSIQARAFTTEQNLFFRQGAYEPASRGGQELIAHELTHVVQQRATNGRENQPIQRRVGFEFENTGIHLVKPANFQTYKKAFDMIKFDKAKAWRTILKDGQRYTNLTRKEEVIKGTYFTLEADDTAGSNVEFVLHGERMNEKNEEKAGFTFQQRKEMSEAAREAQTIALKIDELSAKQTKEPFPAKKLSNDAPENVIVHKLYDQAYLFQATAGIRLDRITDVFSKGEESFGLFESGSFSADLVTAAEKAIELGKVPEQARSPELTSLLTLVIKYISGARASNYKQQQNPEEEQNIKEITPMMARTDFSALYSLLPNATKDYFKESENWDKLVDAVLNPGSMPVEETSGDHPFAEHNIKEWLREMPSKDRWKGIDPDESMGGLGDRTDPGNPREGTATRHQPIFEFRHMQSAPVGRFVEYCQKFFDYVAKLNDERA